MNYQIQLAHAALSFHTRHIEVKNSELTEQTQSNASMYKDELLIGMFGNYEKRLVELIRTDLGID